MPRKGRGGIRNGAPATAYGNRTDLTGAGTASHLSGNIRPYGGAQPPIQTPSSRGPIGAGPPGVTTPPGPADGPAPPSMPPGGLTPLTAGTGRPNEPLTAGLPFGPGPNGPPTGTPGPNPLDALEALYLAHPNADLYDLLVRARNRQTQ